MHIGFDGRKAIQSFTGPGNYSRFVLNLLVQYHPENRYFLYTAKNHAREPRISEHLTLRHPLSFSYPILSRLKGISSVLKNDKIDLFHGLINNLPLGVARSKTPSVVTIHDLIFLRFPEFYTFIDRSIYRSKFKYACKYASRVIAVSEQTKRDIISYLNVPADKIDVVYQGCNSAFKVKATDEIKEKVRKKYSLPHKYLLQVGTIEERKNLYLTVKSLNAVPRDIKLVVIGKETDYADDVKEYIRDHGLSNRVLFLKNVPLHDLPAIYQQAKIFVYPSAFEGFGIPIIEALHSGVPVIAATGSCLEEAGGPDSCYIHPKDDIQLSYTINLILKDPSKRHKMIQAGFKHVEKFSDACLAESLMNVYKKVLHNA